MTLQIKVPNMACEDCSKTITDAVKNIDSAATVQSDLKTKQVNIETQASEAAIKDAIAAAGYRVEPIATTTKAEGRQQEDLGQDLAP
ncbi:MAG: hypothetical protein Kow00121_13480 [Elainellaceae cyanobacterium]